MKSFTGILYEAFIHVNGWVLSLVSLAVAFLTYKYTAETKVPIWVLFITSAILTIILVIVFDAALIAWRRSSQVLPSVKKSVPPPAIYVGIVMLLLVSPSDLYGVHSLVSLYLKEDEYELLIGLGKVLTIQTNGCIQVGLMDLLDMEPEIAKKIENNDATILKKLVVKPSFPFDRLPGV